MGEMKRKEKKRKEKSKSSERTLTTCMDDHGVNEDSNLSRLEPDSVRAYHKEDSQRQRLQPTTKRHYENKGSSMHEDSCIGINYAHAHRFPKCFRSFHTLLGFALYFTSSIELLSFLVEIHTAKTGLFEVLSSHPPSVAADRRQL